VAGLSRIFCITAICMEAFILAWASGMAHGADVVVRTGVDHVCRFTIFDMKTKVTTEIAPPCSISVAGKRSCSQDFAKNLHSMCTINPLGGVREQLMCAFFYPNSSTDMLSGASTVTRMTGDSLRVSYRAANPVIENDIMCIRR
jgi:hypothetical protein